MTAIGLYALGLALVAAAYAAGAAIAGGLRHQPRLVRSGERGMVGVCVLLTVAVVALWQALLGHNFSVQYVAENSSRAMPLLYVVAALWGGQSGSLLLWGWILSLFSAAVVVRYRHRYRASMPWVVAVLASTSFCFTLVHLFAADPFALLPFVPPDGRGLNPLLQHPLMAIHPPLLYLGMVGMVVPYAFAMSALISRQDDGAWLLPARRWALAAWVFLSLGLLLGAKWAYVELGWGGYWGWDPVENCSLMPWLAATAFLHSTVVQQRTGMLRAWNVVLAVGVYSLCIFGTFIARSGVIASVHAFAQSDVGPFLAVLLLLTLGTSGALLAWRWPTLKGSGRLVSLASRETALVVNNWLLLGILFAVLWGTVFPALSEAFTGEQIAVGPSFYTRVCLPLGLALLLLTGAGPGLAWRRTAAPRLRRHLAVPAAAGLAAAGVLYSAGVAAPLALVCLALCAFSAAAVAVEVHFETRARQRLSRQRYVSVLVRSAATSRRRYGGHLVHLAGVVLFAGFAGSALTTERQLLLRPGESASVDGYMLTFETLAQRQDAARQVSAAAVSLYRAPHSPAAGLRAAAGGPGVAPPSRFLATLLPQRHYYPSVDQATTEVAIHSTLLEDVYLVLVGYAEDGGSARFQVYRNPLVSLVWLGGALCALGALYSLSPSGRQRRQAACQRRAVRPPEAAPGAGGDPAGGAAVDVILRQIEAEVVAERQARLGSRPGIEGCGHGHHHAAGAVCPQGGKRRES
jgi:cytochrome c-type biogenesis protein CcmF